MVMVTRFLRCGVFLWAQSTSQRARNDSATLRRRVPGYAGNVAALTVAELEEDVLRVLRDTACTAAEVATVLGTSEQTARTVLGLLALRGAVVTCGVVEGELDVLRRRQTRALWRAASM